MKSRKRISCWIYNVVSSVEQISYILEGELGMDQGPDGKRSLTKLRKRLRHMDLHRGAQLPVLYKRNVVTQLALMVTANEHHTFLFVMGGEDSLTISQI